MNDKLYVGNIPLEYHFARFGNNYIDLFKQSNLQGDLDYYRVYMYENSFQSEHLQSNFNQYNTGVAKSIEVTNDFRYRRDLPSIYIITFFNILIIVFCINLITSVFKKGGLLSGLL